MILLTLYQYVSCRGKSIGLKRRLKIQFQNQAVDLDSYAAWNITWNLIANGWVIILYGSESTGSYIFSECSIYTGLTLTLLTNSDNAIIDKRWSQSTDFYPITLLRYILFKKRVYINFQIIEEILFAVALLK